MANKKAPPKAPRVRSKAKVHPVVIFPFRFRLGTDVHFKQLLGFLKSLQVSNGGRYLDPIFVINDQTERWARRPGKANSQLRVAFNRLVERIRTVFGEKSFEHVRSVDTCQMWLAGLGRACRNKATNRDVYWLVPGDFLYDAEGAHQGLQDMKCLPERVLTGDCTLAIGEIQVDRDNAKQLIDTYGTCGLLYNWFPDEAVKIRELTKKPRTEFFAVAHRRLECLLNHRWFPYEQTVFILLQAIRRRWKVMKVELDGLIDDGQNRETLAGAMEQVERFERALKMYWREIHCGKQSRKAARKWPFGYRPLDRRSGEIRCAALTVLAQYLQ